MHDSAKRTHNIRYEFDNRPESGFTLPVADGIHWLRMPLPFALSHINLWLLEDGDGWTIVDTGVTVDESKRVWQDVFRTTMHNRPATRVIVTHLHPDHAGCAGWLTDHFDVDLWMTRAEYLLCRILTADTGRTTPKAGINFYTAAGFPPEALHNYQKMFGMFGKYVTPLPESYKRIRDGDQVTIGNTTWDVIVGRGHSSTISSRAEPSTTFDVNFEPSRAEPSTRSLELSRAEQHKSCSTATLVEVVNLKVCQNRSSVVFSV